MPKGVVKTKADEKKWKKAKKAGGIPPPKKPFRPHAEATLSDWTTSSFSFRF